MRNKNTIEFLGTWETLYNPNFKVVEFDHFRKEAGLPTLPPLFKTMKNFVTFHDSCYLCQVFKIKRIMAKPIAPTPPLTGQAAVDFFTEMEQQKKATSAERARVKAGAERIKKMLTFNF